MRANSLNLAFFDLNYKFPPYHISSTHLKAIKLKVGQTSLCWPKWERESIGLVQIPVLWVIYSMLEFYTHYQMELFLAPAYIHCLAQTDRCHFETESHVFLLIGLVFLGLKIIQCPAPLRLCFLDHLLRHLDRKRTSKAPSHLYNLPNESLVITTQCEVFSRQDIIKEMSFCFPRHNSSLQKGMSQAGSSSQHPKFLPQWISHLSGLMFNLITLPQSFLQSVNIKNLLSTPRSKLHSILTHHHGGAGRHNKQKSYHIVPLVCFIHWTNICWALIICQICHRVAGEGLSDEVNFSRVMKKIKE